MERAQDAGEGREGRDFVAREASIASLATRQRGIVTAEQLQAAGFSRSTIKRRLRAGNLRRIHRNVYLVGHAAAPEGAAEMAAMLACGEGSAISHRSAARLWKLASFIEWRGPVEISVAGRNVGHKPGLRIYRVGSLERTDVRRVGEVRTTSPARTLFDLASILPAQDLERALADACARGLARDRELEQLLERSRGRRGVKVLRRLIELARDDGLSRSEAERKLNALVHAARLPKPKANAQLHGFEVDFLWREQRVVVEVDGFAFHSSKRAFHRDRARDAMLNARGYAVTRITWEQLVAHPEEVIALIAGVLAVRSAAPPVGSGSN